MRKQLRAIIYRIASMNPAIFISDYANDKKNLIQENAAVVAAIFKRTTKSFRVCSRQTDFDTKG